MKNLFKKSLLVLIGVLLTSLTTQMWAGAGYYEQGGNAIQLCFWCNGADVWKNVASSQASAGDLGTVSTLYLKKFYVYVWQDGGTGISWTKLHWKIYKESDGTTDGNGWTDTSGSWIQDMGGNNKKYGIDSDAGINCLAGLEPGETYIFAYCINTDNVGWQSNGGWFAQRFTVADSKTTFETGKYIYIDARDNSDWKADDFTARFYFKRYDTGVDVANVTCANTNKLENWVYYAAVPEGSYIGKVNVDRVDPANINSEKWCYTNVIAASSRSSAYENCLYKSQDWCNGWSPDWTTYCPPMSSATLSNNSTSVIPWTSGNGTSGNPYLVPASGTIKVSGSATKAVPDNNMTINYDFKVNGSSAQAGTSNTFNKTSLSNNTTYTITMDAYNAYNGATGTKYTASQTLYYKALSTYTITNSLTNMTSTGRSGDDAAAYNIAYTATLSAATGYNLPATITVARGATTLTAGTHYTYNSSTGALSINADQVTGNITITASGVAKTYENGVLDKVDGTTAGKYSVIFHDTKITVVSEPVKAGYQVEGYYLYNSGSDYSYRIAEPNGSLNEGITYNLVSYTDADGNWMYDGVPTLYTKWTPKTYTITLDANRGGIPGTDGSANFTAIFGASDYSSRTMPTREGYTFAGYWTDPSSGVQVLTSPNGGINADVSGYTDEDGKWTNASDDLTLYAHWTDNGTYVFKGGASGNATSWSTAANWTKGVAPSANDGSENIIILAPVEIPASATTNVNSVRIGSAGSYTLADGTTTIDAAGKLTIPATAMLKVTTNVQNYNFSTSTASATTTSTLHIESASSGNGALVWGASGSPGRAQVDFYTKSSAAGNWEGANTDVNQYIGTPFSDANVLYNYYNAWTFKVNDAGTAWERLKGDETMYPFVGYDVIYDGAAGHIFEMDGTLVTNADKICTLSHTTAGDENLLANSWTAPIWIKGFKATDFSNASDASIYIFNSTSEKASADAGHTVAVGGGNYEAFTPGTSGDDDYIQSMQSFSVLSSGGAGSVTLNYTKLVFEPASHENIDEMHAPRRFADGETEPEENLEPKMDFLRLRVADTNGWADELKIYIREDFVEEFENGFDARKMYGDDRAPMLYGISPDGRMAINCIPTADNHVVGFHGGSASNEYTFRFAYDGEEELYLLDNKTGAETLISAEDTYSFTTEAGDNDLRFSIIRKTPAVPTDIETVTGEGLQTTGVQKIMYNGMLYILRSGRIYDATGALVK